jgi:triacylglycerol esterase/lipase EstA (alpha/beta hydrolase family)
LTALAGVGASVSEASTAFTNASKWTLNLKGAVKDVTPFGAAGNWAINLATLKSWTGSITAFLDPTDTAQTNLFGLLGSTVTLTLNVSGTPHGFTGTAIITEIDPNVDVQNAETVDIKFTGTGSCTYS